MIMKVRKKPVEVEAVQWTGENSEEIIEFCGKYLFFIKGDSHTFMYTQTLEGFHRVSLGDYIIKGIKGKFYPCKPDIFKMTYERIN